MRGSELSREATTLPDWSTASSGLGTAALGLGTYLVLSAPERAERRAGRDVHVRFELRDDPGVGDQRRRGGVGRAQARCFSS